MGGIVGCREQPVNTNAPRVCRWAQHAALWLLNLGLVAFAGLKIASDVRTGALLMGVGVVLGVGTAIWRLWADGAGRMPESPPAEAAAG